LRESYLKKGDLLLDRNPLARKVLAGNTIITNDVAVETGLQYPAEALEEGIGSMLSAPLHGKIKPLGVVRAYSTKRNHFTQDDADFITAIASQGSIAIENALAYRELSKLDEMESKFVLTVTHELRSPTSVVRSLLRTLLGGYAGALSEPQRDLVSRASRRADFLQTLTDDLLELAAGKSNLGDGAPVPVELAPVVERVASRFEPLAREKGVTLEWQCGGRERPLTVLATDDVLDRIVNNLVSNAVKYTLSGGRVDVSLSPFDGSAVLTVADTGIGIPDDSLPHLFEEFYRAPNARAEEKEGTGLGLAITRDLVEKYGGHISVQSAVRRGTTFTVTFPLAKEQKDSA
jgi:signal transduction histidine kinase